MISHIQCIKLMTFVILSYDTDPPQFANNPNSSAVTPCVGFQYHGKSFI